MYDVIYVIYDIIDDISQLLGLRGDTGIPPQQFEPNCWVQIVEGGNNLNGILQRSNCWGGTGGILQRQDRLRLAA
jgi:hypothetical protein